MQRRLLLSIRIVLCDTGRVPHWLTMRLLWYERADCLHLGLVLQCDRYERSRALHAGFILPAGLERVQRVPRRIVLCELEFNCIVPSRSVLPASIGRGLDMSHQRFLLVCRYERADCLHLGLVLQRDRNERSRAVRARYILSDGLERLECVSRGVIL